MAGDGFSSSLRVKAEASPGTGPASGFFSVPVTGFDLIPRVANRSKSKVLGASYPAVNTAARGPIGVEGQVSAEGDYNGALDWLLYLMLGGKATTGDGSTDPRTNVYSVSATPPTFHAEYVAGDVPTGKCYRYGNIVCPELVISGDSDGIITAQAKLVAERELSATGGDTPTSSGLVTPTGVPINNVDAVDWNVGAGGDTAYCVRKWTISMRRPLAPPRGCLGSAFYKAPKFIGPFEVDYDFEIEWSDEAMYRAFIDGDILTAIAINYVGPTLLSSNYGLLARVNRSDLDEAGPPAWRDNGQLYSNVKGTGYGNAGSGAAKEPVTFTTKNLINGAVL